MEQTPDEEDSEPDSDPEEDEYFFGFDVFLVALFALLEPFFVIPWRFGDALSVLGFFGAAPDRDETCLLIWLAFRGAFKN